MNKNTMIDFQRDVIDASFKTPIVIDFWAEWCGPCRILGPVLERLAARANGAWKLVKINTELQPDIAMQFSISSIPAVKMVYKGELLDEFVGALPESQIVQWLEKNIPNESRNMVEQAKLALRANDLKKAVKLLSQAVELDEKNFEARVFLAKALFLKEPEKAMKLVEAVAEGSPFFNDVNSMRVLHRLSTDYAAIKAQGEKTVAQAWKDYLKGIDAYLKLEFDTALEWWIDSIIGDRTVDDDGARKACVALFSLLGREHETTQKYHRRFSSALY